MVTKPAEGINCVPYPLQQVVIFSAGLSQLFIGLHCELPGGGSERECAPGLEAGEGKTVFKLALVAEIF